MNLIPEKPIREIEPILAIDSVDIQPKPSEAQKTASLLGIYFPAAAFIIMSSAGALTNPTLIAKMEPHIEPQNYMVSQANTNPITLYASGTTTAYAAQPPHK